MVTLDLIVKAVSWSEATKRILKICEGQYHSKPPIEHIEFFAVEKTAAELMELDLELFILIGQH